MTHICDCEFCESCGEDTSGLLIGVPVERRNKERAVIEAATAWYETWKYALNPASDPGDWALYRAIEALQKARGVDAEPSK